MEGSFRLFYFVILRILLSFKFFPSVLSNKDDMIHANKLNGCKEFTEKTMALLTRKKLSNRLLSGRQVLILRLSSPFHIFSCISIVLRL